MLVNGHSDQTFWDELGVTPDDVDENDSYTEICTDWHEVVLFCDRIEQACAVLTPTLDPNDIEVVFFDEAGFAKAAYSGHPGDIPTEPQMVPQ